MHIPPSSTAQDIKEHIHQYTNDRVEQLISTMPWDSDSYPAVSQFNDLMLDIESESPDALPQIWKSAAIQYARNLAKEMYLLGLRDGRDLASRDIVSELLEEMQEKVDN